MRIPFLGRSKTGSTAIDPVCQMEVDTKNPPGGTYDYQRQTYYFCAIGCHRSFEKEPVKFLSGEAGGAHHTG